jgi:hypothetical protein
MGKVVLLKPSTRPRPHRHPVPRDGWEPAPAEIIEPTYQRTGWAPPGTIAFEAAIDYLNTTYHDLLPHIIRGTIPVLAEHDGTFFLDRPFIERMKDLIDRQLAIESSQ